MEADMLVPGDLIIYDDGHMIQNVMAEFIGTKKGFSEVMYWFHWHDDGNEGWLRKKELDGLFKFVSSCPMEVKGVD